MKIKYIEAYENIKSIDNLITVFNYYGSNIVEKYNVKMTKCEFHNDNNPSLTLYDFNGTGLYKCLSCGAKGNIVSFVKFKEGVEANEAMTKIYEILGQDITPYITNEKTKSVEELENELKQREEEQRFRNRTLATLHSYTEKCKSLEMDLEAKVSEDLIQEIYDGSKDYHKAEIVNHALYKANIVVEIDKYISENPKGLEIALEKAKEGKRVLFLSPTGSGKNYTTINYLKNDNSFDVVLVGPNASNIEQTIETYKIPGAYGNASAVDTFKEKGNVKTFTWDKMVQLKEENLNEHVLLLDEADQIFRDLFREKAIKGFNDVAPKFKGRMDMTGTPTKLDFSEFDYIVEYKQRKQTDYKVQIYNGVSHKVILDILNKSKAFGMLYNNIDALELLKNECNKKSDVISADKKNTSQLYERIINHSDMEGFDGCLNTSVMIAGVNINNPNITDIIVVDVKDIGTIKQYVARYRGLESVNVHIFNNYNDEDGAIYSIEDAIKREIDIVKEEVIKMNIELLQDDLGYKAEEFNLTPLKSSSEKVYRDTEAGVYKVNESNIRGVMYNRYYSSRSARQHRVLLMEQFKNINEEIIKIDDKEDKTLDTLLKELKINKKEAFEQAIKILEKHKELVVGYYELMKEEKISNELDEYLYENEIEPFLRRVELDELNVEQYFDLKKLKEQNKIFTKYVVEYKYPIDFAWNMSLKSKQQRQNVYASMNLVAYNYFNDKIPYSINKSLQEVKIYEHISKLIGNASYYTKEGIEELTKEINKDFRAWNYTAKDVSTLLKNMYNIEEKKFNDTEFNNINKSDCIMDKIAEKKPGKRPGMMKINSTKNIDSLKKELAIPENDFVIENYINMKLKQYFKLLSFDTKQKLDIKLDELLFSTVAQVEK